MNESVKNKKAFGGEGEKIAAGFLKENKFDIIETNFRYGRMGEIDIIAREAEYICFVEVKTRSNTTFGTPSEAVTKKKQNNIKLLAQIFLKQHRLTNAYVRFDIVEVLLKRDRDQLKVREINLIKNAF